MSKTPTREQMLTDPQRLLDELIAIVKNKPRTNLEVVFGVCFLLNLILKNEIKSAELDRKRPSPSIVFLSIHVGEFLKANGFSWEIETLQ